MITALVIKKMGLENHSLVEKSSSRLGGKNLKFESKNGEVVFLKIGEGVAAESLAREKNALEWLKNKGVNVPKVLNYFVDRSDGTKYLLLSALDGLAVHKITNMDRKEILRIVATALKQFHSISMSGSGKLRTLDDDLIHIQTCLKFGLIKIKDFQKANNGKTPEEIFSYLKRVKGKISDSVIVHSDYCLPNILIAKDSYGFLDVGDCGPSDPYKDFSAIEGSITRNFGKEWIGLFYKCYGKTSKVDTFKIEYFQLIDQFGYHLDIEKYRKFFRTHRRHN